MNNLWKIPIDWKDWQTWGDLLTQWLQANGHLDNDDLNRLKAGNHNKYCWDDCRLLRVLDSCSASNVDDIASQLAESFLEAKVIAYHACRPENPSTYFKKGILKSDHEKLKIRVKEIIAFHEKLKTNYDSYIQKLNSWQHYKTDEGCVFLSADYRGYLTDTGHYLIYGSEWIASFFSRKIERDILRSIGWPTLFKVEMPFNVETECGRNEFAKAMLQEWVWQVISDRQNISKTEFSFILKQDVPADWIIDHFHPEKIYDQHCNIDRIDHPTICHEC